jgi:3D (Asp-Asp-Asp) domain-containing protein
MDIFLLKLVGEWLSVLAVSLASFFGISDYQEKQAESLNTSYTKTVSVINEIIPYQIEYVYNPDKASSSERLILVEGEEGLSYTYESGQTKVLKQAVNQIVEVGTGRSGEYVGRLTTYGSDCAGCSKTGTVACRTEDRKSWSLTKHGIYYTDSDFGRVRIIAADLGGFPCGTIILIDNGKIDPFYAVVLDTGGTMRQEFAKGYIWMDLAFMYQGDSKGTNTGSKNTKFTVQRWGW